ncbi:MAG TPA: hypothetical protein VF585_08825 [Chthoniobacterales bacterium]|jgi:ElaB/YqjD/DUF883 family membrane-anchored ribosome-binding protein
MSNESLNNDPLNEPVIDPAAAAEAQSKFDAGREHAKSAANELKSAAGVLKQAATEKASELKETATAKAAELKETATAKAQEFKTTATAKATEFRGKAQEQWTKTREKTRTLQGDGEQYIRTKPTQSVLTALAAGFLLGLLLRK